MYQEYNDSKGGDATGFRQADQKSNAGLAVGEVIAFTGCRSDQTSADVGDVSQQFHLRSVGDDAQGQVVIDCMRATGAEGAGGALTSVFVETMQDASARKLTYAEVLERMRKELAQRGF